MKRTTVILVFLSVTLSSLLHAQQIYLADNGLTASGSGSSKTVSMGGTLNNAATTIDFGSGNASSNFLYKKGTSNYFFIANDGKVGFGTITPATLVDINGSMNVSGASILGASGGSAPAELVVNYLGSSAYSGKGLKLKDNTSGFIVRMHAITSGLYLTTDNGNPTGLVLGSRFNPSDNSEFRAGTGRWEIRAGSFSVNQDWAGVGQLEMTVGAATRKGLLIKAAASQTANLQEWQNSSGTALATVNSAGNFGLGVASPNAKMDIAMGSTSQTALSVTSIASQTTSTFDVKDASGTPVVSIRPTDGLTYLQSVLTIDCRGKVNNPGLRLANIGNGDAAISMTGMNGGDLKLINFNSGSSPTWIYTNKHARWIVSNNAFDPSSPESYSFEHSNQPATMTLMTLKGQASQTGDMLKVQNSAGTSLFKVYSDGKGYFADKVGIGTTNLTDNNYKLFVETGIRTRKVKVDQLTWPDYVFHMNYELRPLAEVEKFIQMNNHLPDVPSAKDIEKEGLDLGDGQAVLLRKIEELTLYIIEQNKKIEQQGAQLNDLTKQLNEIKGQGKK